MVVMDAGLGMGSMVSLDFGLCMEEKKGRGVGGGG